MPWTVIPGFRVEVVARGFQLPVSIAFVPNPGSTPTSPLYYVAELYGQIKVVLRNGEVRTYGPQSWKRADGKHGSKTCENSVLGVIVVGPGRGETFQVCIDKKRCPLGSVFSLTIGNACDRQSAEGVTHVHRFFLPRPARPTDR